MSGDLVAGYDEAGCRLLVAAMVRRAALDCRRGDREAIDWLVEYGTFWCGCLGIRVNVVEWLVELDGGDRYGCGPGRVKN